MPSTRMILAVLILLLAVVAWRLDARRRDACIQAGYVTCSWLPWSQSGAGAEGPHGSGGGSFSGVGSSVSGVGSSVSTKVGSGAGQVP